jgi:N-acyl-D-amino-acid deacylase
LTGASAERVGIKDRGLLKPGLAADIVVLDASTVLDNNTRELTDQKPDGIELVFINGESLKGGKERFFWLIK